MSVAAPTSFSEYVSSSYFRISGVIARDAAAQELSIDVEGGQLEPAFETHRDNGDFTVLIPCRRERALYELAKERGYNLSTTPSCIHRFLSTNPTSVDTSAREVDDPRWIAARQHLTPKLADSLFPFQRSGVVALSKLARGMLADEMGLGKTRTMIAIMEILLRGTTRKALVIAPASVTGEWIAEINETSNFLKPCVIDGDLLDAFKFQKLGAKRRKTSVDAVAAIEGANVYIVSYEGASRKNTKAYEFVHSSSRDWGVLVADESHKLKTHDGAAATRIILDHDSLANRARNVYLVTGTPLTNRQAEIFVPLRAIWPELSDLDWKMFTRRFAKGQHVFGFGKHFWQALGQTCIFELTRLIDTRMLRRFADVELTLPPMTTSAYKFEVGPSEYAESRAKYEVLRKAAQNALEISQRSPTWKNTKKAENAKFKADAGIAELIRVTARVKAPICASLVKQRAQVWKARGEKILVFANSVELRTAIKNALEPGTWIEISGDTPIRERVPLARRFRSAESPEYVAILSIKATGAGLNFAGRPTLVIFAEPAQDVATNLQAMKRIHRVGTTRDCFVEYWYATDTYDEQLEQSLARKERQINALMDANREEGRGEKYDGGVVSADFFRMGIQRYASTLPKPVVDESLETYLRRVGEFSRCMVDELTIHVPDSDCWFESNTLNQAFCSSSLETPLSFINVSEWTPERDLPFGTKYPVERCIVADILVLARRATLTETEKKWYDGGWQKDDDEEDKEEEDDDDELLR